MKLTKKNLFVLLVCLVLVLVVAFSFQHSFNVSRDLATDSGFDSDSGGSGGSDSDFGGSSGGSSGSGGGSIMLDKGTIYLFVLSLTTSIFVIYPIRIHLSNKNNGNVNHRDEFSLSLTYGLYLFFGLNIARTLYIIFGSLISSNAFSGIIDDPIRILQVFSVLALFILFIAIYAKKADKHKLAKEDAKYFKKALDDPSIVREAYDIYVRIQEAWSKNNIEDVRSMLSDEMYNMYSSQIKTMLIKKQRNAMSDFKFVKGSINEHKNVDGQDRYVVILQVYCKDYFVDDETNRVIKGDSSRLNDYTYSLTFLRNKSLDVDKCPNCDAKLPSTGQSVKCSYCGSVIERKATNLVLVEKKMLRQK